MVTTYIIILCLSTTLTAWATTRIAHRLKHMLGLGLNLPIGLFAAVAAILFLTVIGLPAMALVGAILLIGLGIVHESHGYLPPAARFGIPVIAIMLGLATLTFPTLANIPPIGLMLVAATVWYIQTLSGELLPDAVLPGALSLIATLVPLLAAPFFFAVPDSIALDAALILAALAGILLVRPWEGTLGLAREPLAFLTGWIVLEAGLRGAWPIALISALAWGLAIAYASVHPKDTGPHALRS